MSRTPGRRTDDPTDDTAQLEVDDVSFFDVGERLVELSEQLRAIGELREIDRVRMFERELNEHNPRETSPELEFETDAALRKTLTGLRTFRREYDRWERIVAEYVMAKHNYTQRDTAKLLGVGVSTINRWAQNPLKVQDYR